MKIEDCVKSMTIDEETGELFIEFKDEQTPEEVECIKQWILSMQSVEDEYEDEEEY